MVGEKALRTLLSSATNEIGTEISVGLERASASTGYDACTRSGGSLGLRCDRTRLRWQVRSDQRTARRIVGSAISASDRSNHHVPAYMTWSWSCSSCSSHRTRDGVKREASQRDVHVLFREGQTSETSAVVLTNIGWGSTPNHSRLFPAHANRIGMQHSSPSLRATTAIAHDLLAQASGFLTVRTRHQRKAEQERKHRGYHTEQEHHHQIKSPNNSSNREHSVRLRGIKPIATGWSARDQQAVATPGAHACTRVGQPEPPRTTPTRVAAGATLNGACQDQRSARVPRPSRR